MLLRGLIRCSNLLNRYYRLGRSRLAFRRIPIGLSLACLAIFVLAAGIGHAQAFGDYSIVHDFGSGSDGVYPLASVTFDSAGNMYGTTHGGGENNNSGTVWKISSAGVYKELHVFGNGSDGKYVVSSITFDSAGNMYGTACDSGANHAGMVWEITSAGVYKDLHDFGNGADASVISRITFDSAGNMYGTVGQGGANNLGMVWEITSAGVFKDLHDFGGKVTNANGTLGFDGSYPSGGVTFDPRGNMYGTTNNGGPNDPQSNDPQFGFGIVWEITSSGVYKDLHDFGAGSDGKFPVSGVTLDRGGNLFGTTSAGGAYGEYNPGGTVWEITAGGVYKDLHDFGDGSDDQSPDAGVTFDGAGNMYGTASYDNEATFGGMVWEISAGGVYKNLHDFAAALSDGLVPESEVTFDSAGNMYGTTLYGGANGQGIVWMIAGPAQVSTIAVSPVTGGTQCTGTITLTAPAPSRGVTVQLASNSTIATVPSGVAVAPGSRSGTFTITTTAVASVTPVTISATGPGGAVVKATLTINPAVLTDLSIAPSSIVGGNASTGTVSLNGPAPTGGTLVRLISYSDVVFARSTVSVPAGLASVTFGVTSAAVASSVTSTLSATVGSVSKLATLTVTPATLQSVFISLGSFVGGSTVTVTGKVAFNGVVGKGQTVKLSSSNPLIVSVPASATVPNGFGTATFAVTHFMVTTPQKVTITATLGSITQTTTVQVTPFLVTGLTFSPSTVTGGTNSTGTVALNATPSSKSSAITVNLTCASQWVSVPVTLKIMAGYSSGTFSATTKAVATASSGVVTATLGLSSQQAAVNLVPVALGSISIKPTTVQGSAATAVIGTVTLTGPAPAGGLNVSLSSSSPSATLPSKVAIAQGKTSATFSVKHTKVSSLVKATIRGSLAAVSFTATLTITP